MGDSYSVYATTDASGTTDGFGGLVDGVSVSGASAVATVTAGESSFRGGMGGAPGGGFPGGGFLGGDDDTMPPRPERGSGESPQRDPGRTE